MSNLRSDCRDLVKDLPAGDRWKVHIQALCHQIDVVEEDWRAAERKLATLEADAKRMRERIIECEQFLEKAGIQDVLDYPCPHRPDYAEVVDRVCGWCGYSGDEHGRVQHDETCILFAREALAKAPLAEGETA